MGPPASRDSRKSAVRYIYRGLCNHNRIVLEEMSFGTALIFNNAYMDEDNILDQLYKCKYVRIFLSGTKNQFKSSLL